MSERDNASSRYAKAQGQPRQRDRFDGEEEELPTRSRRSFLGDMKDKMDKRKRDSRHKRADRDFESHVPCDRNQNVSANEGPRAALTKGEMGRSQRRAQKMQMPSISVPRVGFSFPMPNLGGLMSNGRVKVIMGIAACLVFSVAFVYSPVQDYYLTIRSNAQMQAELDAINARNGEIQERIDRLSTDEGVEDKLRNELGWVKKGETSVSVAREGSSEITSNAGDQTAHVVSGSVRAPDTWYSGVLDFIFGYDNSGHTLVNEQIPEEADLTEDEGEGEDAANADAEAGTDAAANANANGNGNGEANAGER